MDPRYFLLLIPLILLIVWLYQFFSIFGPWVQLKMSGGRGNLTDIVGMKFRGSPIKLLVDGHIALVQSGAKITLREVESHYLANKVKILTLDDLINSLKENPIETSVAVWIDLEDAQWLYNYLHSRVDSLSKRLEKRHNQDLADEIACLERIERRTRSAVQKVIR